MLPPPYTTADPTPFLQITNIGSAGVQQGIYDIALDPNFATNHFYYVFYTLASPNRDRLSRFTANADAHRHGRRQRAGALPGSAGRQRRAPRRRDHVRQRRQAVLHDRRALQRRRRPGPDATRAARSTASTRTARSRPTTRSTTATGPNWDSIWALGLRNPYRAYYDAPTGRLFIGDVGGNDNATAEEEVDLGASAAPTTAGPNFEGTCPAPCTSPLYSYPHNGRGRGHHRRIRLPRRAQFPSRYQGSYFFADYTQNWIKRLTFDANGNVTGVFNFEPADGSVDGPYGDIVYLTEGPDGALYYVDLGYSDISGTFGVSKIRRIRYVSGNQAPIAVGVGQPDLRPVAADRQLLERGLVRSRGPAAHLLVDVRRRHDVDRRQPGAHLRAGRSVHGAARRSPTASTRTLSHAARRSSSAARRPRRSSRRTDGTIFRAGDVISFSGDAHRPRRRHAAGERVHLEHRLPARRPRAPRHRRMTGVKSGTFTIPTTGHDFSGNTRYRITLTVTDSNGLTDTKSVIDLAARRSTSRFNTVPSGLTLYLDGIAHDDAVRLRHADRLQPHDRGAQPEPRRRQRTRSARGRTAARRRTTSSCRAPIAATRRPTRVATPADAERSCRSTARPRRAAMSTVTHGRTPRRRPPVT